jgi:hypothetical protein
MFTTSSSQLDKAFCEHYNIPFLTKPLSQQELNELVKKMLTLAN